eukprot:3834643-Amphidinium_carterae.2
MELPTICKKKLQEQMTHKSLSDRHNSRLQMRNITTDTNEIVNKCRRQTARVIKEVISTVMRPWGSKPYLCIYHVTSGSPHSCDDSFASWRG